MTDITVLILAGGKSERCWPLTNKLLLRFLGRSFLEQQIEMVKTAGFEKIVVVASHDVKKRIAGENVEVVEQKGEGQGAAILSAKKQIAGHPVFVVNADDVVSQSLFESLLYLASSKHHLLTGFKTKRYFPGGYLVLDGKRVVRVEEKPGEGNEPSQFVRLVCDFFTDADKLLYFLDKVPAPDLHRHYEITLTEMMNAAESFEMLEYEDTWIPLKYPWQTLDVMGHYLQQIKRAEIDKSAQVHKTASITGEVVIAEGARVMEYAKLVGPLYVGAGAIIGNHTLIRHSMVGENSVVGFSSDVTRSYIGTNSWFHSNYIGDSIVGDNVGMGAGAVLANLRLDEKEIFSMVKDERLNTGRVKFGAVIGDNARIGVEAQLMPGVKVGKHSVVGPGVILQEDLPDKKVCYVKQELTIKDNVVAHTPSREKFRSKI